MYPAIYRSSATDPRASSNTILSCVPSTSYKFSKKGKFAQDAHETLTHLYDAQNERAVLEVIFKAEVNLSDVLARLRIVDVHVDQGDRPAL